ncbi:TPA: hypothetical protein ACH3X3_007912 [Trebouxia sp. C0006]
MGQSPSRSASPTEPSMPARDAYREPIHYPEPYRESRSSHGYEPRGQQGLAPPFGRSPPQDQYNPDTAPLGYWIGLEAWRKTKGIASIDLRRPTLPGGHAGDSLLRTTYGEDAPTNPAAPTVGRRNPFMTSNARPCGAYGDGYAAENPGVLGSALSGARCKVLRCVEWGGPNRGPKRYRQPGTPYDQVVDQKVQGNATLTAGDVQAALHNVGDRLSASIRPVRDAPLFNFGIGASFELDRAAMQPICRVKIKDFLSIKLLPRPMLKLHKRFPLGNTGLALRVVYDCPLEELDHALEPPARLLVRLDNKAGSGIHVGPSGVEFDERVLALGANAEARFGASVGFPRQLPVVEGQQLFNWDIHRLGLKTRW